MTHTFPPIPRRPAAWAAALIAAVAILLVAPSAQAVTHLQRGQAIADLTLPDLDGKEVKTADYRGQSLVIIFGELYHGRSRQACERVDKVLHDSRLRGLKVTTMLVVAENDSPVEVKKRLEEGVPWPAIVLHDRKRQAFGEYRVAVLPSLVVVDPEGKVVHAIAGLIDRFDDVLTDALLLSAGKLSPERFEETLHPQPTTAPSDEAQRAERITQLANQLVRRGMAEMGAQKYAEALELDPRHESAHLGLGRLLLKQRRLADAEKRFRTVLEINPDSADGALGLAFVQTLRGGEELTQAEDTVRKLLARTPSNARAHYLLGLIHEQRQETEQAAADFKRAAQLFMEQVE